MILQEHSHSHPQGRVSWSELVGDFVKENIDFFYFIGGWFERFLFLSNYKKVGDASLQSLAGFRAEQTSDPLSDAGVQHNRAGE